VSVSRTKSDRHYALHGLALLTAVALLLGLVGLSMRGTFAATGHVTALMSDVGGGIVPGANVKMRGLVVGRVVDVGGDVDEVRLDLELDDRFLEMVPAQVRARVLPASVFGTSFLDLVTPGGDGRGSLSPGDTIAQDTSARTLELQQALDSVDQLVSALGPADLAVVLNALAGSLDGRGADLRATIGRLDHLLSVLNPRIPLLREDLRLLAVNVRTVRQVAPDLLDSLADTAVVGRGVVEHSEGLTRLLQAALALVDDGDGFLDATEQKYVRAILLSADVSSAVYDNRAGLPRQTRALDELLTRVLTVTDGGPIRTRAVLVDSSDHPYYTPADCPRYGSAAGTNCSRSN